MSHPWSERRVPRHAGIMAAMSADTPFPDDEDELAWLERIESLLLHGSDHALFAIDGEGRISAWRSDAEGGFSYPPQRVLGVRLPQLFPEYEAGTVEALLAGSAHMESRRLVMRTARGTFASVELLLDGGGPENPARLGSVRSVVEQQEIRGLLDTGRRRLQARAQRHTNERREWDMRVRNTVTEYAHTVKQLQAAKEEARAIVDTAHDAFVAIDAGSVILEWNRQAEVTFGWSRADAIGRGLVDTILPPQHREAHLRGIEAFLRSGEGPLLNRRVEVPARHRDGHLFPVEMTIWPIEDAQGARFNAFLHDISERKQQERRAAARYAAVCALVESDDPDEAVDRLLAEMCAALDWSLAILWRIDGTAATLRPARFHARDASAAAFVDRSAGLALPAGVGLPGEVLASGRPLWLDDFPGRSLPRTAEAAALGLHGAFAFPVGEDGHLLGVIECFSTRVEPADGALLAMLRDIGRLLGRTLARQESA